MKELSQTHRHTNTDKPCMRRRCQLARLEMLKQQVLALAPRSTCLCPFPLHPLSSVGNICMARLRLPKARPIKYPPDQSCVIVPPPQTGTYIAWCSQLWGLSTLASIRVSSPTSWAKRPAMPISMSQVRQASWLVAVSTGAN